MADWTDALSAAERQEFWWARHQAKEVLPAMEDSAMVMGKPVILLVDKRAAPIPDKLRQVADEIVEVDLASDDPAVSARDRATVQAAMARVLGQ